MFILACSPLSDLKELLELLANSPSPLWQRLNGCSRVYYHFEKDGDEKGEKKREKKGYHISGYLKPSSEWTLASLPWKCHWGLERNSLPV